MFDFVKQFTISNNVSISGIGLHTGNKINIIFRPASEGSGVIFRRIDLRCVVDIYAVVSNVVSTSFSTSLMNNRACVNTVEHLLSAIFAIGIDNIIVDLDGDEIPILDGSSYPFIFLFNSVGLREQCYSRTFLKIKKSIIYKSGSDKYAIIKPYNGFKISLNLNFREFFFDNVDMLLSFVFSKSSYIVDISRARTFGFINDYEFFKSKSLARGANLNNVIILNRDFIFNEYLVRYKSEILRHKVLDACGDLFLLGKRILGSFYGFRSGHTVNIMLLDYLLKDEDSYELIKCSKSECDFIL
ncbi:MAG TPA: UDP-3-O-acyl-N-acetylglucosamine deacetylase [Candidatus Azoamicus sp. OHIO1]